jgi:peroxiredoxin
VLFFSVFIGHDKIEIHKNGYSKKVGLKMVKRIVATSIILIMFSIVIIQITNKTKSSNTEEDTPVMIEDENWDGMAVAYPDGESVTASASVNKPAPDFTLDTLSGETLKLSDLRGKYVFLNFWATWCTYCIDEMPAMQKFYENNKDEVVIIGLNATGTETSVDKVQKFVDELGVTFPIVLDKDLDVLYNDYQALALPTTFFIDKEGIIKVQKKVGPMDYEMMKDTLKELKSQE